jgi:hypothetical protein
VPTQHLGGGETRSAAAGDENAPGRANTNSWRGFGLFGSRPYEDLAVTLIDDPEADRVDCGRADRFTGAKAKPGVMPGTTNGLPDKQALGERPLVVGASGADGEERAIDARDHHLFLAHTAVHNSALGHVGGGHPKGQVGKRGIFRVHSHRTLKLS